MKIVIFGASGFLGSHLKNYFSEKNEIVGTKINVSKDSSELDVTNKTKVLEFLNRENPEVVIDTVALTSSVACEQNPKLCKKLNYNTAKNIADACRKLDTKMIFLSSSYVFDGERGNYSEKDIPNPLGEYARNKLLAEKEVLRLRDSIVLRVDLIYGLYNKKLRAGTRNIDKEEIEIGYSDQLRSPVFIEDVSKGIEALITQKQKGIFNLAGPDKIKMSDFLSNLIKISPYKPSLKIIDPSNFVVKSPKKSTLDISKIVELGIKTISFKEALLKIKKDYNKSRFYQ